MFSAWQTFRRGKARKNDVMDFEMHLEDNIFSLYEEIKNDTYRHSAYTYFQIFDNKKRDIYKASVRDRIVHQIVYEYLLSWFEPIFIPDSYASRKNKGQYNAISTFRYFIKLARSQHKECYVLKCDVRKYFDNVDHGVLIDLIKEKVFCEKVLKIIKEIISSYDSSAGFKKGIPLGNITSQIFANIYLNKLDQYVKKELGCRFYVRYNDDLVVVSSNNKDLLKIREKIIIFVKQKLSLDIPLAKTSIRKISWGVDFLGFTILPKAILLRDKTKHKIYENISRKNAHSYLAILKYCNSHNLKTKILAMEKVFRIW
ncbi:MAG: reverse transcriptase/maturase family protein [Minisyncoccia bacterium]